MFTALLLSVVLPTASADGASHCFESCNDDYRECELASDMPGPSDCDVFADTNARLVCMQEEELQQDVACTVVLTTCYDACGQAYSGSSASLRVEDCPPGTVTSPLGTCLPSFGESPEDQDPDDGCPAGFERGPTDDCIPSFEVVPADVIGGLDDWGFLVCPDGMVPGPVGGCVWDTTDHTTDPDACPPGFIGGPDGRCVPDRGSDIGRMAVGTLVRTVLAYGVDQGVTAELFEAAGVVEVEDVGTAIEELEAAWRE